MLSSLESYQKCSVRRYVELQLRGVTTWIDVYSTNMVQHTKMRRLYLREPSALISTEMKNTSIKANTLSIFQKSITLISKLLKKALQISKNFFHEKKKNKVKMFYTLVNSVLLAVVKLQASCIMFVSMMVTVKLILERNNLTAKWMKDIIIKDLRETHFALLEGTWNFIKVTTRYC